MGRGALLSIPAAADGDVERHSPDGAGKEGLLILHVQPSPGAVELQQRLLDRVLSVVPIAQQPESNFEHEVRMPLGEGGEAGVQIGFLREFGWRLRFGDPLGWYPHEHVLSGTRCFTP